MARVHTESAIRCLAGIMGQPDAPPSARVAAAECLLSRGWGKPLQQVEHGGVGDFDRLSDEEIRQRLAQQAMALKALGFVLPDESEKAN